MTGYGHTRFEDDQFAINVEVKTLNSKFLDVNIRIPRAFSDKEMEIRNLLGEVLERGKINLVLDFLNKKEATSRVNINEQLFSEYFGFKKVLILTVTKSDNRIKSMIQVNKNLHEKGSGYKLFLFTKNELIDIEKSGKLFEQIWINGRGKKTIIQ